MNASNKSPFKNPAGKSTKKNKVSKTDSAKKSAVKPNGRVTKKQAAQKPDNIYAESVVWQCTNLNSGLTSNINGVLAQVLKKYPKDYELQLLEPQPSAHK